MDFLKKNYILMIIVALTIFLRVNIDTFALGCNFDEFAIMSLANVDFFDMLKAISKEDYHAPFYYLIAHSFSPFASKFIILRLLNVLISVFNVILFYKIGKLLLDKKTGYFFALFFALNHMQISVVNFAKYYALAIFLVSLSVYYFLKILIKGKTSSLSSISFSEINLLL